MILHDFYFYAEMSPSVFRGNAPNYSSFPGEKLIFFFPLHQILKNFFSAKASEAALQSKQRAHNLIQSDKLKQNFLDS